MKNRVLLLAALLCSSLAFSQQERMNPYTFIVNTKYLRLNQQYDSLLSVIQDSIIANPSARWTYYQMACVWALKGDTVKPFEYLYQYIDFQQYTKDIFTDTDFDALRHTQAWQQFKDTLIACYLAKYPDIPDKELSVKLWLMGIDDQRGRTLGKNNKTLWLRGNGVVSEQNNFYSLKEAVHFVWDLLQKKNYLPTYLNVGKEASDAAFLVIQHSSKVHKMRKILPAMTQAAKEGIIWNFIYACIYDSYLLSQKEKQCYGTQYVRAVRYTVEGEMVFSTTFCCPIENASEVNRRRTEIGLEPIENVLKERDVNMHYFDAINALPFKQAIKLMDKKRIQDVEEKLKQKQKTH